MKYKWVLANVSVTLGGIWEENNDFMLEKRPLVSTFSVCYKRPTHWQLWHVCQSHYDKWSCLCFVVLVVFNNVGPKMFGAYYCHCNPLHAMSCCKLVCCDSLEYMQHAYDYQLTNQPSALTAILIDQGDWHWVSTCHWGTTTLIRW